MPLNLKIITPERVLLEQEVDEVSASAVDGEFAILPDHEPLITALGLDVLRFKSKGTEEVVAILGGILEVNNNTVTVLSDAAERGSEIDEARARQAEARAEAEKTQRTDKLELFVTEMALARALARLKALNMSKHYGRRHM